MSTNALTRTCAAVLLGALAACPAMAEDEKKDDRPVSSDKAAKMAIDRFQRDFKTRDEGKRVTKKLGQLLRHKNEVVRQGAAMALDDQYNNTELAGEILRKHMKGKEKDFEVLITCCLSVGRLDYKGAISELGDLAEKHNNAFVKIEALKTFGKLKDKRALMPILRMWLKEPQGYSWEGGEVTVDTGAPGDKDQKEAERQYKAKYGNQHRRGGAPTMLKTYVQAIAEAVKEICGEEIEGPTQLMEWMVEHKDELGYPLPGMVKSTLKEWKDRAAKRKKQKDKKDKKK
ncbi:MAG: HEAT repeat domain-containing protein [Planctomycetota bacterium]|jgi:hypothetical protein